jgi:ABC-2 family transporter protein
MTAHTMPAQPAEDTTLRPLPWRRMAGVMWRQHRLALVGVAALLGAVAAYLWIVGSTLHSAYAAAVACHPVGSPACQDAVNTFNGLDNFLSDGILLQIVPVLIGAFVGAPLLAREMETGTFRYTWTQGFGRWRWTLAKLVALGLAVTVAAELFSLVVGWYYQPYFNTGNYALTINELSPFDSGLFDLGRVTLAGWTLGAFAIGALAGMLIRRVLPAIAATLAVYAGLAFAVGGFLREHYLTPPVTTSLNLPHSTWVLSQWWTKGGVTLSQATMVQVINPIFARNIPAAPPADVDLFKQQTLASTTQYLTQHGYTYWTRYQPGSRFWPFQWIESGWLFALSVALIAATVWLVRRRAA